jgi:GNAT superfamily N-acetyltransferase
VAVVNDTVVAFVLGLTRQVPLFLQGLEPDKAWITAFGVHPDHQRKGIGKALFEHLLEQFRKEGRRHVAISPYVPNYFVPGIDLEAYPKTISWLERHFAFKVLYQAISMGADLTGFQIPEEILRLEHDLKENEGITIQSLTAADLPELMPFIVKQFGWDWYRHTQEYLLEYFSQSPHQICFFIARQHGKIVAYCQQRRERFGPFGVNPAKRNLGIGRVLLFRCLAEMSAKQNYYAYFLWTGEDAARLYSLAGFKRRRVFAVMSKELI